MGADPERTFSGPEREYIKETYDVMLGTFKDYAEMTIQVPGCITEAAWHKSPQNIVQASTDGE